jgi:Xaa-Pro aminopeptidase
MGPEIYHARAARLASALTEAGIDAFFANYPVTMSYLSGFGEDAHERFLTIAFSAHGHVAAIVPSLSESQVRRAGLQDVRSWPDGEDPIKLFRHLAEEWDLKSAILAVDDTLPAHMLLRMQETLPAALFKPGGAVLGQLMRQKEKAEIDLLRHAGRIADDAFDAFVGQIKPGMTERQLERVIREELAARGGEPTFCIVATGANGAEPHHLTDDSVIQRGDVLILDFGCDYQGYQADITRTVAVGEPDADAKKVYEIVHAAHMAGRKAIQPGVACSAVDAAARKVIEEAGYGQFFFHRTGHGIGMNVHETPYISQDNSAPLEVGNCFSIEPGIYLAGKFGVRIENIVACTENGHLSMNVDPSLALQVLEV